MSTKLKNFTPVIDEVADDVGFVAAYVYGAVFRYAQMSSGHCTAAAATIAKRTNTSEKTVRRHLKTLVEKKYLIDKTPKRRNAPHKYALTDKAGIDIRITGEPQNEVEQNERLDSLTKQVGLSDQARLDSKSDEETLLRDSSKKSASASPPEPTSILATIPTLRAHVNANQLTISEATQLLAEETAQRNGKGPRKGVKDILDAIINPLPDSRELSRCLEFILYGREPGETMPLTQKQKVNLGKKVKELREIGISADDMRAWHNWWKTMDWRGKKGDSPMPSTINETWGKFKAYRDGGASNGETSYLDTAKVYS